MITIRRHDSRGSIPIALLVIITLSGVIGALVVTTVGSTEAARFDREYTEVIQSADAGAQAGSDWLIRALTAEQFAEDPATAPTHSGSGTLDGIPYTWTATKTAALTWQVVSTGTGPEVARTVVVEVQDFPRFFLAAFADRGFRQVGGNGADSYGDGAWITENGYVGSNETITILGNTRVDGVHLYDWDNNPDINRCQDNGAPDDCADVLTFPDAVLPSARIGPRLEVGAGKQLDTRFIDDYATNCVPNPPVDYFASTYGAGDGVLGTPGSTTVLCFQNFTADRDITIQGTVEIYVYGDLISANHTDVNCPSVGCPDDPTASTSVYPDALALTFYVADSGDPDNPSRVNFGNNNNIVAGIYAPTSECISDQGSNAQTQIFGSLICREINNQGGWQFHYDDRLGEVGVGQPRIGVWREE